MKKILLLLIILTSVFASNADPTRSQFNFLLNGTETLAAAVPDGFIENISIYPNPVMDLLKISFKCNKSSTVVISLFNTIGKQIYTQQTSAEPGSNLISIDIRNKAIEPGIYFIQCKAEDEIYTRKLIVK